MTLISHIIALVLGVIVTYMYSIPSVLTFEPSGQRPKLHAGAVLPFALVSDLDHRSRHADRFEWYSYIQKGFVHWDGAKFSIELGSRVQATARIATNNRSMELSDLHWWNGKYLAVCDYTGLVWKVRPDKGDVFPRYVLADGDGKTTRTLKAEWMATYGDQLFIGSHGKEWVQDGAIVGRGGEWVKVIEPGGTIRSIHWVHQYGLLRHAANASFPGYLSHEAVVFNRWTRQWMFLPRKASTEPYDDEADETRCTNLLLLASEDFSEIEVRRVGPHEDDWGFTSMAIVPGTMGQVLLATKVRERGDEHQSKLTLFDVSGKMLLDPPFVAFEEGIKYEGVAFLGENENW